jgi:alpha-galactosidase
VTIHGRDSRSGRGRGRKRPASGWHDLARIQVEPGATVYAEGWQSWSIVSAVPVTTAPYQVTSPESLAIDCQYAAAPPPGVHQGSGLLAIDPGGGAPVQVFGADEAMDTVPRLRASRVNGSVQVSADGPVSHTADAGPGGLTGALGRWGERFAARAGVPAGALRPVPPGWCSWYQYYAAVTQEDILTNLAAMDHLSLDIGVVQIDDGYQAAPGDWLVPSAQFGGLPGLITRIRGSGRRAGIWVAPMLVGRSSALFAEHPDWVVRSPATGEPVFAGNVVGQLCTALDVTHPGAAAYLTRVFSVLRDWGADYFKLDFAYAGACEGVRHEQVTGVQAYRQALRLIRAATGPQSLLVGCGAPILPTAGLVDAMRVGPDIAPGFAPPDGNPSKPSQVNAARNVRARAWQHGRLWVNDPDCLIARPDVERREDWAATVQQFGGLRASGDELAQLDDWGLSVTRRLLVPSPTAPLT